jgi:hypothetical protein
MGARMHYGVPALLQRANMLRHFYTDAVGNVGILKLVNAALPSSVRPPVVKRLLGRRLPPEIPPERVTTTPLRSTVAIALNALGSTSSLDWPVSWLRNRMIAEGFRGANALYSLGNDDLEMIREAKQRGMFVVYEQIICGDVGRIMREERARFPGIEPQDSEELVEAGIRRDVEAWNLADVSLAASEFVREGMVRLGAPAARVALVPYGLPEHWYGAPGNPVPGRVLFVGSVGLRKGNHYLAQAFRILKDRGVDCQFRAVGPYDGRTVGSPIFAGPEYVGQVPREQVREEFARADVFAFPTVAEGFALVSLEALALGVPVVTTPNSGSVVRDGVDGFVVPIRDAAILADRIEAIVRDRALRDRMSQAARERAKEFSWPRYCDRLLGAIEERRRN